MELCIYVCLSLCISDVIHKFYVDMFTFAYVIIIQIFCLSLFMLLSPQNKQTKTSVAYKGQKLTSECCGESRIKALEDSPSGERLLSCSWTANLLLVNSHGRRDIKKLSRHFLIWTLFPFRKALPLWPNYLPKPYLLILLPWGLEFSHHNKYGVDMGTNIQTIASV